MSVIITKKILPTHAPKTNHRTKLGRESDDPILTFLFI
tara:strand:+ start:341 stop:454 length:114 start_codon:yes stop_codon:yes gene_type:complete